MYRLANMVVTRKFSLARVTNPLEAEKSQMIGLQGSIWFLFFNKEAFFVIAPVPETFFVIVNAVQLTDSRTARRRELTR